MLVVHVDIQVKAGQTDAFIAATIENCRCSSQEPGIVRFELVQDQADASRFCLIEIYRTVEDTVRHKETAHYATWRDTVADMMAVPRTARKYTDIFPTLG